MIVKTSRRRVSSTAQRSAREVFRYIHQAEKGVTPIHTGNLNLLTEGYEVQREEFALIASMAKKSTTPVAHFILSWHEHEKPTAAQADEAVRIFSRELGVETYVIAYAMHDDTKNRHLHIAVNRANPATGKVLDIKFSVEKAHRALAHIERAQGWQKEANAVFDFDEKGQLFRTDRDEHGKYIRRPGEQEQPKKSPGAQNFERRTGQRSAEQIAADDLAPLIKGATSWKELHTALERESAYYVRGDSGAVLFVNGTPIKASAAHRDAAFSKLGKRLGGYEPGPEPRGREGVLLDRKAPPDVRAYAEERTRTVEARDTDRTIERERHAAAVESIKGDAVRNAEIVAIQARRGLDPLLARDFLGVIALIERDEQEALKARRAKERARRGRTGPLRDYAAYLRVTGQAAQAEAFRYRNSRNYLEGAYTAPQPVAIGGFTPTKVGREIHYQRDERTVFIDKGSRITVTAATDDKTTLAALRTAHERWGEINLRGAQEFRRRATLISLAAGLKVVEAGPGIDIATIRHELDIARQNEAKGWQAATSTTAPADPIAKPPQKPGRDLNADGAFRKESELARPVSAKAGQRGRGYGD